MTGRHHRLVNPLLLRKVSPKAHSNLISHVMTILTFHSIEHATYLVFSRETRAPIHAGRLLRTVPGLVSSVIQILSLFVHA